MTEQVSLKALIVEDQEMFRLAVADELTFLGFEVETTENGEDGLKAALTTNFDIILSDIRMPVRDGQWFLEQFRRIHPTHPPFIFMTGFADLAPAVAFDLGADGFLAKPLDPEKLERVLKKLCNQNHKKWSEPQNIAPKSKIARTYQTIGDASDILLGRSGIFLKTLDDSYRIGDVVSFDIRFSNSLLSQIQGTGSIVWKRSSQDHDLAPGIGINFEFLTASSIEQWANYLRNHNHIATIPIGRSI